MFENGDCCAGALWSAISRNADTAPDRTAVVDELGRLSNAEFRDRVLTIAEAVRGHVDAGSRVGVCMEPGIDQHVAIVGVMAASCTYVPLDIFWSDERLAHVCSDAELRLAIHLDDRARHVVPIAFPGIPLIEPTGSAAPASHSHAPPEPRDECPYVMYTSGTTGAPKGVATSWPALRNRLEWMQELHPLDPSGAVAVKASCGFDVSIWEHLWPHLTGAAAATLSPVRLGGWSGLFEAMMDLNVTVAHFVPSYLRAMLDDPMVDVLPSLRFVALSGEVLDRDTALRAQAMAPNADVYNLYGPAECAIDVSYWRFRPEDPWDPVPIGSGAPGSVLTVRHDVGLPDREGGNDGELVISGVQVAAGYIGAAARSGGFAELLGHGASYMTGDRAVDIESGLIAVTGRLDRQVKVNGVRVELDGLEAVLRKHPQIDDCAVFIGPVRGAPSVVVAYVSNGGDDPLTTLQLRAFVRGNSAAEDVFLHPRQVLEIPLSGSGKTDYLTLSRSLEETLI